MPSLRTRGSAAPESGDRHSGTTDPREARKGARAGSSGGGRSRKAANSASATGCNGGGSALHRSP